MEFKQQKSWIKHLDFIIIDLICLELAFLFAYWIRHGVESNPYGISIYRNEVLMLVLIQLLVAIFTKNFKNVLRRGRYLEFIATFKQVMLVTRITLLAIALIAMVIALDENSVIFNVVSFAWAGFGATFGPLMLFSLFWKRTNRAGAIAGMLSGGGMVFLWKLVISKLGGAFAIYELLPAFILLLFCLYCGSFLAYGSAV